MIQLWQAGPNDELSKEDIVVNIDGSLRPLESGGTIRLYPGESITIPPYLYHRFWAEEGYGKLLLGEVSMVNDDNTDNRFYEEQARFPAIEEDEATLYYLCNEYPR